MATTQIKDKHLSCKVKNDTDWAITINKANGYIKTMKYQSATIKRFLVTWPMRKEASTEVHYGVHQQHWEFNQH